MAVNLPEWQLPQQQRSFSLTVAVIGPIKRLSLLPTGNMKGGALLRVCRNENHVALTEAGKLQSVMSTSSSENKEVCLSVLTDLFTVSFRTREHRTCVLTSFFAGWMQRG